MLRQSTHHMHRRRSNILRPPLAIRRTEDSNVADWVREEAFRPQCVFTSIAGTVERAPQVLVSPLCEKRWSPWRHFRQTMCRRDNEAMFHGVSWNQSSGPSDAVYCARRRFHRWNVDAGRHDKTAATSDLYHRTWTRAHFHHRLLLRESGARAQRITAVNHGIAA